MKEAIKKIILCYDNSGSSITATDISLHIAKAFSSEIIGIHAYNASMHEGAFRIMEPVLPGRYQKEEILTRQRQVHEKLINVGMEKISLSYLRPLMEGFSKDGIRFTPLVKEGKNFKALSELINSIEHDLVVIGSSGFNSDGKGFIGSVCLRLLRSVNTDFFVVKTKKGFSRFLVCLDGSRNSFNSLEIAGELAERFGSDIYLLYVYDGELHRELFRRLRDSLINSDGFSFNSSEQERLHDEFIDKGLAQVGEMILKRAEEILTRRYGNRDIKKEVLCGRIYEKICEHAEKISADIIFLGRTGRHYVDGMDIGSVTENVVRFAYSNIFITRHEEFRPWEF